ncbi:hypothetical protein [Streptomyces sp. NPDC101455]|uniref:hypothetical protein n=1 Tax=Streptomyces sp. NPDC101455 TaxID=3366142 RepID=UPI00382C37C5
MMPHARARFQPYRAARRTTSPSKSNKSTGASADGTQLTLFPLPHPAAPEARPVVPLVPLQHPLGLEGVMRDLSPRAELRVDTRDVLGQWLHEYKEAPLVGFTATGPYALHLTDAQGRFRWVVFDLDVVQGDVGLDLARLLRCLDEAGLAYVTVSSGPGGGRHVWVTSTTPLAPGLVKLINTAAKKILPTLDPSVLSNPRTCAVRPVGAPHLNGGRAELMHPDSEVEAARLLTPASCGNAQAAFERLAVVLGADPREASAAPLRPRSTVVRDRLGPRLSGTPRALLDDATMAMLRAAPGGDASRALAAALVRLAVRRWTWPMVRSLLAHREYRAGALLHACSRRRGGYRTAVSEEAAERRLERQWIRCVDFAARLPELEEDLEWSDQVREVVAVVVALQTAADAVPGRWAIESGPADRAALDLLCLYALKAGTLTLDMDVRRAALAVGHGRSTMHRAFAGRLAADGFIAREDTAGSAGSWRVLPLSEEHPLAQLLPQLPLCAWGGTQGTRLWVETARTTHLSRLQERLDVVRSDVFSYGRLGHGSSRRRGGLGHHTARIYLALHEHRTSPLGATDLAGRTGYRSRSVVRGLVRMQELMVVAQALLVQHHECPSCEAGPGEVCRLAGGRVLPRGERHTGRTALARRRAPGERLWRARGGGPCLVTGAQALGVHGTSARRARLYAAEVELWHWWQDEVAWMESSKKGVRTGARTHDEQGELVLTTLAPKVWRRRYPRQVVTGVDAGPGQRRADHRAAWQRVLRRMPME